MIDSERSTLWRCEETSLRFFLRQPVCSTVESVNVGGYPTCLYTSGRSPTHHPDMIGTMKTFLFLARKADLAGKIGGAFRSYVHDGNAPKPIFDTMEFVFKMDITDLGPFNLLEPKVYGTERMRACQAYGKAIGEKLSG